MKLRFTKEELQGFIDLKESPPLWWTLWLLFRLGVHLMAGEIVFRYLKGVLFCAKLQTRYLQWRLGRS